jgi:hypothetical protein
MARARFRPTSLVFAAIVLAPWLTARGDDMAVPLQLQVDLSVKVIEYAQEPPAQSADVVRIGIVFKADSPESSRAATELKVAFDRVPTIAGRPHEQAVLQWKGATSTVEEFKRRNLMVVYFTPGLDSEVPAAARALQGVRCITIASVDSYVRSGALLGFELVSGHPKMVFNLGQAKKQEVVFRSAVMKLMRLVE